MSGSFGDVFLEAIRCGVLVEYIVQQCCLANCVQHGRGRFRHGVAYQSQISMFLALSFRGVPYCAYQTLRLQPRAKWSRH